MRLSWTLLLTSFLFVFAKFSEPGLGISSTTYGALARDILENGHWFNPTLGQNIFDPFVDHPYLVLWIKAFVFKFLGASAQTVRLTASVLGLLGFIALFKGLKNVFDEKIAYLSCILLMTITVYMNYHSSGWLDLPMVSFCIFAFFLVSQKNFHIWQSVACGLMISCAVLSKGAGALLVFPIFIFAMLQSGRPARDFVLITLSSLIPISAFTVVHFKKQGFFFWHAYIQRQFSVLNDTTTQLTNKTDYFWYLTAYFQTGHLVAILSVAGIWSLVKKRQINMAVLILGTLVIHFLAYGMSSRHYTQYLLPLFPWMATAAAFFLAGTLQEKIKTPSLARWTLIVAAIFFVSTEILPIRVHSSSGDRFKSLQRVLYFKTQIKTAYFLGDLKDQSTWEAEASYIRWYLNKWPVALSPQELNEKIASLNESEVVLAPKGFSTVQSCAHSSDIEVYLKKCEDLNVNFFSFSDQNEYLP